MKLLRLMKIVADAQNLGGKLLRSVKSRRQTIYDRTKADGMLKSPRLVKLLRPSNLRAHQNLRAYQNLRASQNLRTHQNLCAYQNLRVYQNLRAYQNSCGKVRRPLTIWARKNLQLLTSSKSG